MAMLMMMATRLTMVMVYDWTLRSTMLGDDVGHDEFIIIIIIMGCTRASPTGYWCLEHCVDELMRWQYALPHIENC